MLSRFDETTVLDAAVVVLYLEIEGEVEILQFAPFPYNEGVSLGRSFLGRLSDDGTIFHPPELGIAVPTIESLAVEEIFTYIGLLGSGRQGNHGDCEHGGSGA